MDPKAEPFDDFIAPVRQAVEGLAIADMHHYWWKSIPVPANWKVAQEAFFEAFHVPATHPQLEKGGAEVILGKREDAEFTHRYVTYDVFQHGHGAFYGGKKTPMAGHVNELKGDPLEEMAARLKLLVDGMDAMVLQEDIDILLSLRGKPIPEGSSLGGEYVKALYADAAAHQRPMPKLTPEILGMWGGEIFIFPNLMILPQAGNAMIYRVRPNGLDPDSCTFEILSTRTLPAAVQAAAAHGAARDQSAGSRADSAHSAPGPGQYSAHAERPARARARTHLARSGPGEDHPEHASGARSVSARGLTGQQSRAARAATVAPRLIGCAGSGALRSKEYACKTNRCLESPRCCPQIGRVTF